MSPDARTVSLQRLLQDFIAATDDLSRRLDDEASALLQQDLARLDLVTVEKQRCIETLERIEGLRRTLVTAAGGDPQQDGFRDWLGRHDPGGELDELWSRLTRDLETCRERNVQNGRLVAMRRAHVVRSLSMLRGSGGSVTYNPDGNADSRTGSRNLARA